MVRLSFKIIAILLIGFFINLPSRALHRNSHSLGEIVTSVALAQIKMESTKNIPEVSKVKVDPGQYTVDADHSKVGFEIPHLVVSTVDGTFRKFEGTVVVAPIFANSKVTASATVESVDTGVVKRDNHLRSADFFDAKKFPKMIFASKTITGTPENFTMAGDLTIKATTKPVKFTSRFLGAVPDDGFGNRKVVFEASTSISRKEFGILYNPMVEAGAVVGDEVAIRLRIEAARPKDKKSK